MRVWEKRVERLEEAHWELREAAKRYTTPPVSQYDEQRLLRAGRRYYQALRTLAKGSKQ